MSQPPVKYSTAGSGTVPVNLANNRKTNQGNDNTATLNNKEKQRFEESKVKKHELMAANQTMSVGSFKSFDGNDPTEQSPTFQYKKNQSRFQFAHSLDPIKKEGGFKFGFGLAAAASSELDQDEIVVPMKV